MCDPVLGDDGRLYVPEELVGAFRELVTHADLVTPNQFECECVPALREAGPQSPPLPHTLPQPLLRLCGCFIP